MAKTSRNAPGTYVQNGVRCTVDAPFGKARNAKTGAGGGIDGHNKAPFDKPQDTGNGGIPTRFFDGTSSNKAATVPAPGQKAPSSQGPNRKGTIQNKY